MKSKRSLICGITLASAFNGMIHADPAPQPQVSFTQGSGTTWNADWTGILGRSYFSQGSTDLVNWEWFPLIEFSDGLKGVGVDVEGSPKYFFRLAYTDEPTTEPELEDFANDGIGSLIKVLMGLDPFVPLAWEDTDSDGIHDAIERFWFSNSLTGTDGGDDDANGNGIRDVFEIQSGDDPTTDQTGDAAARSNYQYDSMGRLTVADDVTYAFDIEGNLESSTP
jgi:hypothetical protein